MASPDREEPRIAARPGAQPWWEVREEVPLRPTMAPSSDAQAFVGNWIFSSVKAQTPNKHSPLHENKCWSDGSGPALGQPPPLPGQFRDSPGPAQEAALQEEELGPGEGGGTDHQDSL